MLTGKERSRLKAIANGISPITSIGKSGLTDAVVDSIDRYIAVHELAKISIQEGVELDPKETCNEIADRLGAEFVQAIGRRFVIYRQAVQEKNRKIEL